MPDTQNARELVAELRAELAEPDLSPPWPTREDWTLLLDHIVRLEGKLADAEADVGRQMIREAELSGARALIDELGAELAATRAKLTAALDTVQPVVVGRGEA